MRLPRGAAAPLLAAYALFALAAGARAGVQIADGFERAPLAYVLSAGAAVIYLVNGLALAGATTASRRVVAGTSIVELSGVLTVGTVSLLHPEVFPDATVWSGYGRGYGFVPVVLPVLALLWLRAPARRHDAPAGRPVEG